MLFDPKWEIKSDNEVMTILRKAKEIISDKSKWTCGSYAIAKNGWSIGPLTSGAVSFCSIGALALAMNLEPCVAEDSAACRLLCVAASEKGANHATRLNDSGGHAAALWMFDRAIELAGA